VMLTPPRSGGIGPYKIGLPSESTSNINKVEEADGWLSLEPDVLATTISISSTTQVICEINLDEID
jgi:hypothetical protein